MVKKQPKKPQTYDDYFPELGRELIWDAPGPEGSVVKVGRAEV